MQQIIALGGGGFSMEPENLTLDRYILDQTGRARPAVCFLPQASGEAPDYVISFYRAFTQLGASPNHLSLFRPHTADLEDFLLSQDVIYVGGGNTKSMLALWAAWGLDVLLKKACASGVILAGVSAGAICWFEQGLTDSIPGRMSALPCLGYLPDSATPHYDGEAQRRPVLLALVAAGELRPGYAFDDGAAGHFVDGALRTCVSSRPAAGAYFVTRAGDQAEERPLETRFLG